MKNIIYISKRMFLLAFFFLSGCSSAIQVASQVPSENTEMISDEVFLKKVNDTNVKVMLRTGQSKEGKVISFRDSLALVTKEKDTLYIQRREIQSIADKHTLAGAVIGFPIGFFAGMFLGGSIETATTRKEGNNNIDLRGVVGATIGAIVGSCAGVTVGILMPPTTTYEFNQSSKIYEKEHTP
jgi:hypothetical protein